MQACVKAMIDSQSPIDVFFHDWRHGLPANADRYADDAWTPVRDMAMDYSPLSTSIADDYWEGSPCSMHIEEVEAIWSAIDERDDWTPLHEKVTAIRRMGAALAK